MKKTLFAALALVSMASCSNEEVLEVAQKEAIGFENAFVNNSTRSVEDPSFTSEENGKMFSNFAVYGFVNGATLFNGTEVKGSGFGDNATWNYEGNQYWVGGAKYNFAAIAPLTNGNWNKASSSVDNTNKIVTTLDFTNNGITDLLYAANEQYTATATGNSKVGFTFNHILSKVKFTFVNQYTSTGATIRVENIHVTNAHESGSVTLTLGNETNPIVANWTVDEPTLNIDFGNAALASVDAKEPFGWDITEGTNKMESYNERFIIPGSEHTYIVTFDVQLLINGAEVTKYSHQAEVKFTPVEGHSYNITTVITPSNIDPANPNQQRIEFTVTEIDDWTPGTNPEDITTTTPVQ